MSEETSPTGFSVAAPSETSSDFFSPLAMTERSWAASSGVWFWIVIALGAVLRLYLVFFTEGTQDVAIWERHARDVRDYGLMAYYHGDPSANHPPFITELEAFALRAANATGIPFRILLRAPFALLDLGTTFLLFRLFGECRWRFIVAAVYWLTPLAIIFSAYHGNTDSAVAFFLALCVWLLSKNKLFTAAIALGVSLWIKLPIVLAIPAFVLFIPEWRSRFQFLAIAGVVALVSYLPALILDPMIIWKNVLVIARKFCIRRREFQPGGLVCSFFQLSQRRKTGRSRFVRRSCFFWKTAG